METVELPNLDELLGLHGAKRAIRALAKPDSGVHAVLLYGAEGVGKTTLSRIVAQNWLCKSPGPDGACGECKACLSFIKGVNTDLFIIEPKGLSAIIKVGDISDDRDGDDNAFPMQRFLRTMPLQSRHKVVIIESADRMNEQASNSLLKALEEPESYTKFVLTTRSVRLIRPTILSRCLAIACEAPTIEEMQLRGLLDTSLPNAASLTPGQAITSAKRREIIEAIDRMAVEAGTGNRHKAIRWADELKEVADKLKDVEGLPARAANTEALHLLAQAFVRHGFHVHAQQTIEAHRRVLGNGSFSLNVEGLFTGFR